MVSYERFLKEVNRRLDLEKIYRIWKRFYPLSVVKSSIDFQIRKQVFYYWFFVDPDRRDEREAAKQVEDLLTKNVEVF